MTPIARAAWLLMMFAAPTAMAESVANCDQPVELCTFVLYSEPAGGYTVSGEARQTAVFSFFDL